MINTFDTLTRLPLNLEQADALKTFTAKKADLDIVQAELLTLDQMAKMKSKDRERHAFLKGQESILFTFYKSARDAFLKSTGDDLATYILETYTKPVLTKCGFDWDGSVKQLTVKETKHNVELFELDSGFENDHLRFRVQFGSYCQIREVELFTTKHKAHEESGKHSLNMIIGSTYGSRTFEELFFEKMNLQLLHTRVAPGDVQEHIRHIEMMRDIMVVLHQAVPTHTAINYIGHTVDDEQIKKYRESYGITNTGGQVINCRLD